MRYGGGLMLSQQGIPGVYRFEGLADVIRWLTICPTNAACYHAHDWYRLGSTLGAVAVAFDASAGKVSHLWPHAGMSGGPVCPVHCPCWCLSGLSGQFVPSTLHAVVPPIKCIILWAVRPGCPGRSGWTSCLRLSCTRPWLSSDLGLIC